MPEIKSGNGGYDVLRRVMKYIMYMYVVKMVIKLGAGAWTHLSYLSADGTHNGVDLIAGGLVLLGFRLAQETPTADKPHGYKDVETIFVGFTGILLFLVAVGMMLETAFGVLSHFPTVNAYVRSLPILSLWPEHKPAELHGGLFYVIWVCSIVNATQSILVSRWQIRVGRKFHNDHMVANGEETRVDGRIEIATAIGLPCEYFLGTPWVGYLLGVIVTYQIMGTAWELCEKSVKTLLKHSIDKEHIEAVQEILRNTPGLEENFSVVAIPFGSSVECTITIECHLDRTGRTFLEKYLKEMINSYLQGQEFASPRVQIVFSDTQTTSIRNAWPIKMGPDGTFVVTGSLQQATHIRFTDQRGQEHKRPRTVQKPANLSDLLALLRDKRVARVNVYVGRRDERASLEGTGIAYILAPTYNPRLLGI